MTEDEDISGVYGFADLAEMSPKAAVLFIIAHTGGIYSPKEMREIVDLLKACDKECSAKGDTLKVVSLSEGNKAIH